MIQKFCTCMHALLFNSVKQSFCTLYKSDLTKKLNYDEVLGIAQNPSSYSNEKILKM